MFSKKWIYVLTLCATMGIMCSSCSSDDNDTDPLPEPDSDVKFDPTKDNDKSWMEQTAIDFLNYFNANDQASLLQLASFYDHELSRYDFPEDFSKADNERAKSAANSLMRSIIRKDYYGISRAVYTYTYNMARFQGIYEPNSRTREWTWVKQSDDLVFNFVDDYKKECTVSISGSKDTWHYERKIDGDYFIWDVPNTVTLKITRANETLVDATVKTKYVENSSVNATIEASLMNVTVNSVTEGDNTSVNEKIMIGVNNTTLVKAEATVKGKNLCNIDSWESTFDSYDESRALANMIDEGNASVNVLGRMIIKAKITNVYNLCEYFDFYAYSDESDAEREAKDAARKLTDAMEVNVIYNGSNDNRANLGWEAYISYSSQYSNYVEWSVRPLIIFTSDSTPYDFESYFGNDNFFKVENLWDNIINKYEIYF